MVTAGYSSDGDSIAIHFLFTDDARVQLDSTNPADTLVRIKLLTNLAFLKEYNGYQEYRKEAARLDSLFWRSDTTSVTQAYHWALRVMEIRDWGWFAKMVGKPVTNACLAFDSISSILAVDSSNEIIRFLRINVAIEMAPHAPYLLDTAYLDLCWLDVNMDGIDRGASFFTELLWAKYYYWCVKKQKDIDKLWYLENAQCYLNSAFSYAQRPFYEREIVCWKKMIDKEGPVKTNWSKEVENLSKKKK